MLACARIGATHNVVFGGFASKELSVRIDASKPCVIIAGSNGVLPGKTVAFQPIIDKAIEMSEHKPQYTIYKNRSSEVRKNMSSPCLTFLLHFKYQGSGGLDSRNLF